MRRKGYRSNGQYNGRISHPSPGSADFREERQSVEPTTIWLRTSNMQNAKHTTNARHDVIIVAFRGDIPRIAFWRPECAAQYAMRTHRTNDRIVLQFFLMDLVPWEETLVAESFQRAWFFEGLASTHEVDYARLVIPLV